MVRGAVRVGDDEGYHRDRHEYQARAGLYISYDNDVDNADESVLVN